MLKNNKYQLLSLLSLVGLVVGLFIGGSNWQPIAPGLPDAGPALTWFGQIAKLIFTGLGVIIFGRLVSITFLARPDSLTKSLSRISVLANLWAVVAILTAIAQMSYVLGLNYQQIFSSGVISTYIFDLTSSRGYVISAVIAIAIAVIAIFVRNENTLFLLVVLTGAAIATPLLNSHAASLGDHSMALTSSVVHGIAVSAWVGTLIAVIPQIKAGDSPVVNRFGALAKWSVIALSLSGLAATYTRLDSPADFYQTGYGQLVLIKVTLFIMAVSLAGKIRSALAKNISLTKFLTFELAFLATAIGFGVALQNTALSRESLPLPTAAEEILGFEFPPPPSIANYAFGWHPEWVMLTLAITGLAMYLYAVRKLRLNEVSWPIGRTISFLIGISLLIWASSSGIAKYAMISFSAHMIQHMVLSMIAPIFLVLSAPITLALRTLPINSDSAQRNARDWLLAIVHSSYSRRVTNPISVLIIFTFGLYAVYFTPLFANLMRSHTGHVFMEMHFLLSGFLFAFVTVGVDPAPRVVPHWAKLMMVLIALGLHTFFALAIMQSTTPIGVDWYGQVQPPWMFNLLKDSYAAGGVAWAIGEVPTLILAIIVVYQWARSDTKLATRLDRAAQRDGDAELNSYNEKLARLNKTQNTERD